MDAKCLTIPKLFNVEIMALPIDDEHPVHSYSESGARPKSVRGSSLNSNYKGF